MSEILDRYALLVGLNHTHDITNKELEELHKLYHEISHNIKLQELVKEIDMDKLIELVHQMDLKTPVVGNSRTYFVDLHYQLVKIKSLIEESCGSSPAPRAKFGTISRGRV